jgi:spermidine/putrescine-binding protein
MKIHTSKVDGWKLFFSILLAGALVACSAQPTPISSENGGGQPQPISKDLVVLDWSGYDSPDFRLPFGETYPDVQPKYSYFADDAEAYAKAQSGFEFDLVHPCVNFWQLYVDFGLVQPLDTSRLSNWDSLYSEITALGQFNGQQYFVPYDWGYDSILVRSDKVQNIPQSWADLWDEQYAGHLALFDSGEINHIMAATALGFDPWNTTAAQNEAITQKLLELKPNVLTFWTDYPELVQMMSSGDIWVAASAWNDAYAILVQEGVPVEYVMPTEGRFGWVCGFGLSSKVKNIDLAYAYIDAMLDPQSMANMINEYAYGGSSPAAIKLADQELVELLQVGDPVILQSTIFYRGLTDALRQIVTDRWIQIKAAP